MNSRRKYTSVGNAPTVQAQKWPLMTGSGSLQICKNTHKGNSTANTYSCFVQNEKIRAKIIIEKKGS